MANNAPFPIIPELTAIAIAYSNRRLIADQVLPRVPVGKSLFKYLVHAIADGFTVPNTRVGRKSKPNEIEFSATSVDSSTDDYGLEDPIPSEDIANAPPTYDPVGRAVEGIMNLVLLDREIRTANLVFNPDNYGTNNKLTLSGGDQFSDPTSNPIKIITDALDSVIMRPNIMTIGRKSFSTLVSHPMIVKAIFRNAGDAGIVKGSDIANLFELDAVYVGEGFVNTAKKGQPMSIARVWGPHLQLSYRDTLADTRSGTTFGFTAQFGTRLAGSWPDRDIGLDGGERVRAGEKVKELISAPDLGFLLTNVTADV